VSYEGYVQHQCGLGHSWAIDAYDPSPFTDCPTCCQPSVWSNSVDTTNGSIEEGVRIDGYVEPVIPEFYKYPKIPRLQRNCIITEKIDGTNGQILITEEGEIWAGSRARWLPREPQIHRKTGEPKWLHDNYNFGQWVQENKEQLIKELGPGRHFGEWWGLGIQRRYDLTEKRYTLFNITKYMEYPLELCSLVPVLYQGPFTTQAIDATMDKLKETGSKAAPGYMNPEGIVVFHEASGHLYKRTFENDDGKEAINARTKEVC